MVESRLRSSTARTSSSRMPTASFGSGLPPLAAMSPPALWTRMSIGPNSFVAVSTTRAMSAPWVRSPSTRIVRTPCVAATCSATAVSVDPSPYSAGPSSRMPWIAISAPRLASRSANARPSPRPAPVTSATLPISARAASCVAMMYSPDLRNVSQRRDRGRWRAPAPGTSARPACAGPAPACPGSRTRQMRPRRSGSADCR